MPGAVALLPKQNRLPMGLSYIAKDVLRISGAGPGAVGYYREGEQRYRIFALQRPDEDSAKDVMKTFRKLDGAKSLKDTGVDAIVFNARDDESSPEVGWVVGRKGGVVIGVGDEVFALRKAGAKTQREPESKKLERVKAALAGGGS
jgi:hypothetical protein